MDPIVKDSILALKDVVVVLGFPLAIFGATLALEQLKRTIMWNKLNATFALFGNKQYSECQVPVAAEFARLGMEFYSRKVPLTEAEVTSIVEDSAAFGALKSFLNYLEDYATALNVGVLHKGTAFQLMGDVITRHFRVYQPLILHRRRMMEQPALWCELQIAAIVFNKLLEERAKEQFRQSIEDEEKYLARLQKITSKEQYGIMGRH